MMNMLALEIPSCNKVNVYKHVSGLLGEVKSIELWLNKAVAKSQYLPD